MDLSQDFLKNILENKLDNDIKMIKSLSGGDINLVYKVHTTNQKFVVKVNKAASYPKMLIKEQNGLEALKKAGIFTPDVLENFVSDKWQIMVLSYIEEEPISNSFWKNFAIDLAKLHQTRSNQYGLDYDNYIGSLTQKNTIGSNWVEFFVNTRLQPMVTHAYQQKLIEWNEIKQFEGLYTNLSFILPEEKPTLLHGDLWRGNLMCKNNQTPVFIDPAIYFGNREIDIAMTQLFGGFSPKFLSVYHNIFPLEKEWEERIDIYNLYPNLVHLNLFGASYLEPIKKVLTKFS